VKRKRLKPYCLRCYETLDGDDPFCPGCGFNNRNDLRRKYWTREINLVQMEFAVKLLIVIFCALLTVFVIYKMLARGLPSPHAGWLYMFGLVAVCTALWETASNITHRDVKFKPTIVWVAAFVILGALCLFVDARWSAIFAVLSGLVIIAGLELQKWKYNKIGTKNWYDGSELRGDSK
jgi:hypothetical protein